MNKNSKKIEKRINPTINVGDKVYLCDGSALSHRKLINQDFYITESYPSITGIPEKLNTIPCLVVKTGISRYGSVGPFIIRVQDIVVKIGKAKFRTCSKFVTKI